MENKAYHIVSTLKLFKKIMYIDTWPPFHKAFHFTPIRWRYIRYMNIDKTLETLHIHINILYIQYTYT